VNNHSVEMTDEEIHHLIAMLRIAGFREKRDIPKEMRAMRNAEMRITGRIMKKLRKAMDERPSDATAIEAEPDLSNEVGA